jgi:hypothetical protein
MRDASSTTFSPSTSIEVIIAHLGHRAARPGTQDHPPHTTTAVHNIKSCPATSGQIQVV